MPCIVLLPDLQTPKIQVTYLFSAKYCRQKHSWPAVIQQFRLFHKASNVYKIMLRLQHLLRNMNMKSDGEFPDPTEARVITNVCEIA